MYYVDQNINMQQIRR